MTARIAIAPVLVIDDSLTIRKLLEMALERAGHPFEVAGNGREGLALAARLQPKLILLDYVLPDLKGSEVCDALAAEPATAAIPVVVMSGKGDDIRPLFRSRRTVVDFVAKPFSPAEILHVINRALASRRPGEPGTRPVTARTTAVSSSSYYSTSATRSVGTTDRRPALPPSPALEPKSPPPTVPVPTTAIHLSPASRDVQEGAAKLMFSVLKDRLAKVPEWLSESPGTPVAPFLARKLLTPEAVGQILVQLSPLVASSPAQPPTSDLFASPEGTAPSDFTGSTGFLPLPQLLRLIADTHRTGELLLGAAQPVSVFIDRGRILAAMPRDLETARRLLASISAPESPEALDAWERTEAEGGLPPGLLAAAQVPADLRPAAELAVQRLGRQALVHCAGLGPMAYAWRDLDPLPEEIPTAGKPIELDQLALDRLRQVDDWSQIELEVRSLDQRCRRSPKFRQLLVNLQLTAEEERILALVDGRRRVKDLLDRSRMSTFDVFHILYRMIQLKLIEPVPDAGGPAEADGVPPPRGGIVVCHAGTSSLVAPLAAWLDLPVTQAAPPALGDAVHAQEPRLVLLDLTGEAAGSDFARTAKAIRGSLAISDVIIAAVVDRTRPALIRQILQSGIDDVLTTPFHRHDLDRLLDGRPSPPVLAAGLRESP